MQDHAHLYASNSTITVRGCRTKKGLPVSPLAYSTGCWLGPRLPLMQSVNAMELGKLGA